MVLCYSKANHIHVTDIATPSAVNNDYTRLRNAVELLSNGKQVNLFGSFDWVEANAAAAWALGNDILSAQEMTIL